MTIKGVLIAAPRSPRLGPTEPSPAVCSVGNRPIVWHAVRALRAAGASEIAVVGSPEALEEIRGSLDAEGERAVRFLSAAPRGDVVDVLQPVLPFVGDAACIVYVAEGLASEPVSQVAQLLALEPHGIVVALRGCGPGEQPLGSDAHELLGVNQQERATFAGICGFGPGILEIWCRATQTTDPEQRLLAAAHQLRLAGGGLFASWFRSWRRFHGDPSELVDLNRMVLDDLPPDREPHRTPGNRIEGRVRIDPSALVTASVIIGPAIIGPGTRIDGAYIGPYTTVGRDVRIEGAEVSDSVIADGVEIANVAQRIENSTVGRGARICRDFSLPRAMRVHLGACAEVVLN